MAVTNTIWPAGNNMRFGGVVHGAGDTLYALGSNGGDWNSTVQSVKTMPSLDPATWTTVSTFGAGIVLCKYVTPPEGSPFYLWWKFYPDVASLGQNRIVYGVSSSATASPTTWYAAANTTEYGGDFWYGQFCWSEPHVVLGATNATSYVYSPAAVCLTYADRVNQVFRGRFYGITIADLLSGSLWTNIQTLSDWTRDGGFDEPAIIDLHDGRVLVTSRNEFYGSTTSPSSSWQTMGTVGTPNALNAVMWTTPRKLFNGCPSLAGFEYDGTTYIGVCDRYDASYHHRDGTLGDGYGRVYTATDPEAGTFTELADQTVYVGSPGDDAVVNWLGKVAHIVCISAGAPNITTYLRTTDLPITLTATAHPNHIALAWPPLGGGYVYVERRVSA